MASERRTHPPGRDLDALVAERVLGWTRHPQPKDARGEHGGEPGLLRPGDSLERMIDTGYQLPPLGRLHLAYFVPQYSTDHDAAWRLVRELRHLPFMLEVSALAQPIRARFGQHAPASSSIMPHAIALAALNTVPHTPAGEPEGGRDE